MLITLAVLKKGRDELLESFLKKEPDIYTPCFKYENSPALLKLAREKYFISWLNGHWKIFSDFTFSINKKEIKKIQVFFSQAFLELLRNSMIINSTDVYSNLSKAILEDMQTTLERFIEVGNNAEENINTMKMAQAKAVAIFNRKIKQLTKET